MIKAKDRDFIETDEGLIFCVIGYLHPPERYTAYLKYIPSKNGRWGRNNINYQRTIEYYHVTQIEKTYNILKKTNPDYMYHCPVRNIILSTVPKRKVKRYFKPKIILEKLLQMKPKDSLHYQLINLTNYLTKLGIKYKDLGVTGSILTGIYNPEFSDIDLTVYGIWASEKIREGITKAKKSYNKISPLNKHHKEVWLRTKSKRFHLEKKDLIPILNRKWNFGEFEDRYFSIHPIRNDDEITEEYGERTYHQRGVISGTARISDASEAIYLPAIYKAENLDPDVEITQIVSYEGIYSDIFRSGEKIDYRGMLEEVKGSTNYYRVVIGGAGYGKSYLRFHSTG
jgi:hypothetical protein